MGTILCCRVITLRAASHELRATGIRFARSSWLEARSPAARNDPTTPIARCVLLVTENAA
jgi:hypothetical protein